MPRPYRRPAAPEPFRQALAACHVALPITVSPEDPAVLIDGHGNDVLVVDPNGWRSDADVAAIARLLADAVNQTGGVAAEEDPACRCRPDPEAA